MVRLSALINDDDDDDDDSIPYRPIEIGHCFVSNGCTYTLLTIYYRTIAMRIAVFCLSREPTAVMWREIAFGSLWRAIPS